MNEDMLLRLLAGHDVQTHHVVKSGRKYWRAKVTLHTCTQAYVDSVTTSIQERLEGVDCDIMPGKLMPNNDRVVIRIEINTPESLPIKDRLQALIEEEAPQRFTAAYVETADPEDLHEQTLGVMVSVWSEWTGETILRVCMHALEDANFRSEAAVVSKMLTALRLSEGLPAYTLTIEEE